MCNLHTYRVMPPEMDGLKAHFRLIGQSFAEAMRMKKDPDADVYPNRQAPVLVMKDGEPVARTDMLWGFPPYGGKGPYATNYRTLNNHMWRDWLDREHRCVVPATALPNTTIGPASPRCYASSRARMACHRSSSRGSGGPSRVMLRFPPRV